VIIISIQALQTKLALKPLLKGYLVTVRNQKTLGNSPPPPNIKQAAKKKNKPRILYPSKPSLPTREMQH